MNSHVTDLILEMFKCDKCSKSCNTQGELNRHLKRHTKPLRCEACQRGFPFRSELEKHIRSKHRVGNDRHRCDRCTSTFERKDNLKKHVRKFHANAPPSSEHNSSTSNATKADSLPQNAEVPSLVDSLNVIYSTSMFMQAARSGDIPNLELLMEFGFTTEMRADDGSTVLHCAARSGQARMVRYLVEKGANINACNKRDRKPLHEAFLSNDLDTVKVLIESGADDSQRARTYLGPRYLDPHYLSQTQNIEIVLLCGQHSGLRFDYFRNIVFANAIMNKNDTLVAAIIERTDLSVNGYGKGFASKGRNLLHVATFHGRTDIVEQLLRLNFDVECIDDRKRTPLQIAAMRGRLGVIKLLVDKWNADLSSRDRNGQTPLHHVAFNGNWESVQVILGYIASKSEFNTTGIQLVNTGSLPEDVLSRLLNQLNLKDPNIHGPTSKKGLLHAAAQKGQCEMIAELLSHKKIDINAIYGYGRTALMLAVERKHIKVARILLQHPQIDVNVADGYGQTALMLAVRRKHIEIARLLLQHPQIDVNLKTAREGTALSLARSQEMVHLLFSHGAVNDQKGDAPAINTESSNLLTTMQTDDLNNTSLQPENEANLDIDFDTFMDGIPSLSDISDDEDEVME